MSRTPRSEAGSKDLHPKGAAKRKAAKPKAPARSNGKHPGGRPTDYQPEYCDQVITWGKLGKSRTWMASRFDVIPETLTNWGKAHPEFFDALTRAKAHEQAFWEDLGESNMTQTGFASSAWSRSMSARFPKEWAEKKQIDHGVTDALAALLGEIDGDSSSLC